ncbi:MAG: hypothetical protein Kow00121_37460 [Elainellaceae cyanobacterium]
MVAQAATPVTSEPAINQQSRLIAYWVLISSLLVGAMAIAIGVYQRDRNERWYRIEFLRKAVKEFEQDPEIWKALKILDFEEYRDYEMTYRNQRISFQVDNEMLCAALASHEERSKRKQTIDALQAKGALDQATLERYQMETALRDWFNKMLNGLEHFGYFVESGMFSANEIRPWMIYWIRLIADRTYKRPGASKFYDQLYTYIHDYGFSGVIKLFEQFGYRILPTPYIDTDFVEVSKRLDGFDVKVALSLAKTAYLIYEDLSYVAEISSQRWGVEIKNNFRYINNRDRDTQAFMFRTPDFVVISFRGSQERKDWQTNFSTRLKKFAFKTEMQALEEDVVPPKGQVHRGFQAAWNSVEIEVIKQIRRWNKERSRPLPILITGHSLGGALATVAAASLVKRGFNIQGLYTFGQPRVGDLVFANEIGQLLKGKVFRFVNNNDIVPQIPPPYLPWNPLRIYVHMGQMYYFNARGNLTTRPNPFIRAIDLVLGLIRDAFKPGFDAINDHRMEFYISNLKKALEIEQEKEKMLLQEAEDEMKQ